MNQTEPIIFRDDVTIKADGGGVSFSLDTMHRQQCIAIMEIQMQNEPLCMATGQSNAEIIRGGVQH